MVTMSGTVELYSDEKPYHSGERIELNLEVEKYVCAEYCEKCDKIQETWE